ncbi:hypothetical protein RIF29_07967 [Crotalaria pallida]|uniref:RING-type domain-containing protein n=1 Tax=Crotalaria pallida TaxID=3830 RepID=A0AAN9J5V0_CROPI
METRGIQVAEGFRFVFNLVSCVLSAALTSCFAIVGALIGALAGALAATATKTSFLRGTSVGAIVGVIISVEVLEASRSYWSMTNVIEELIVRARAVEESLRPVVLSAYNLQQAHHANRGYDEIHDGHSLVASRGRLSGDSLNKSPQHLVLKDMKVEEENTYYCTICLQDIKEEEKARSLPRCRHIFHLICVDKWLARNDSCPVCRQGV